MTENPTRAPALSVPTPAALIWIVPAAIVAIAVAFRLIGLDKSLWIDEAGSLAQAKALDFIATARNYDHPPLYFAILRSCLLFTENHALLRLFSVACGVATALVFCLLMRPGDRIAGWCAGGLIAISPAFAASAQELRQYALLHLAFASAFVCARNIMLNPARRGAYWGVALALSIATCTHLISVFFVIGLAAVIGWSVRRAGSVALWRAAAAVAPAVILTVFFVTIFLHGAEKDPGNWWIPIPDLESVSQYFGAITAWASILTLQQAANRNLAHSGDAFLAFAVIGVLFTCWVAWMRRPGAAHALLAMALISWGLILGFSLFAVPIALPRTLLPGMLPLYLGLAIGVATHPRPSLRIGAVIILACLAVAASVPWLRTYARLPVEDLRGFTATVQKQAQSADLLILVNGVEVGLVPYWPEFDNRPILKLDLRAPLPDLLATLRNAQASLPREANAWLLYREDLYLPPMRTKLDAVVRCLADGLTPAETVWDQTGYHILRFSRS